MSTECELTLSVKLEYVDEESEEIAATIKSLVCCKCEDDDNGDDSPESGETET